MPALDVCDICLAPSRIHLAAMDIALLAGIIIPVTTRPFVITHPPTIPGLAAPTMSIAELW